MGFCFFVGGVVLLLLLLLLLLFLMIILQQSGTICALTFSFLVLVLSIRLVFLNCVRFCTAFCLLLHSE